MANKIQNTKNSTTRLNKIWWKNPPKAFVQGGF